MRGARGRGRGKGRRRGGRGRGKKYLRLGSLQGITNWQPAGHFKQQVAPKVILRAQLHIPFGSKVRAGSRPARRSSDSVTNNQIAPKYLQSNKPQMVPEHMRAGGPQARNASKVRAGRQCAEREKHRTD